MWKFRVLAFIQCIALCYASLPLFPTRLQGLPQFKDGAKYTGKIVGGETVNNCNDFPYQVSIQRKSIMSGYSHFCGGSVINKNYVLTAGHCVNGRSASSISVVVGTHKLDSSGMSNGVRRKAEAIYVHEKYNSKDVDYDVAIIKLEKSIDLEHECVSAVGLPSQDENVREGTLCFATGWGTTSEGGSTSSTLRAVAVPIVADQDCKDSYGEDDITPRMLCAGLKDGGKDACQGDSGGPLTCNGVQYGITSWGYGCARPNYYGVYSRVSHFSSWVNSKIGN